MDADRRSGRERRARSRFHLTPREIEVLTHVLKGEANRIIAAELGITEQAVKDHVSTLLDKFDVPNRAALAEAGARFEFSGELGVDRSWMHGLFLGAEPIIVIARGPEIRYEAGNEAFAASIGGRPFVGRTMRETFPELGESVYLETERVFQTGVPVVRHEVERSWDRGHGIESRLLDIVIQPLRDDNDKVNGVVAYSTDVTDIVERRRRSELLNEELAALLDLVPSGVAIIDDRGRLVRINEAGRRIARTNFDPTRGLAEQAEKAQLRDRAGHAILPGDMLVSKALRGEETPEREFTFVTGTPPVKVTVKTSIRTLRDHDGAIRGALVVFTELRTEPT